MWRCVAGNLVLTGKAGHLEMNVGVDKSGYHDTPAGIELLDSASLLFDLGARSYRNDPAVPGEHRFRHRPVGVHCQNSAIDEGQVVAALGQRLPGNNGCRCRGPQEFASSHFRYQSIGSMLPV
jgi:hypothetical protein